LEIVSERVDSVLIVSLAWGLDALVYLRPTNVKNKTLLYNHRLSSKI